MVEKNIAKEALLKALDGTLSAAGLSLSAEESTDAQAVYQGETGSLCITFEDIVITVSGTKDDKEKEVSRTLFEPESDSWTNKDTLSTAADLADSIASFFGVEAVSVTTTDKKANGNGKKQENKPAAQAQSTPKKSKKQKADSPAYDAIHLAYRMEVIFPQLVGLAQENLEQYGEFLAEEYFETTVNPLILETLKKNDRQTLKKIFKTLNSYYEEGEKDTQSLVAVTILGMNMAKDPAVDEAAASWLDEDLGPAVKEIVAFLKKNAGQRAIKKYQNPKPYKESAFHKLKSRFSKGFKDKFGDPSQMMLDAQSMQNMNR